MDFLSGLPVKNPRHLFRLLKKLQMRGVEERGMRRTFLYVAITSDEDNKADGFFVRPVQKLWLLFMSRDTPM